MWGYLTHSPLSLLGWLPGGMVLKWGKGFYSSQEEEDGSLGGRRGLCRRDAHSRALGRREKDRLWRRNRGTVEQRDAEGNKEEQSVAEISRGWHRVAKWRRGQQRRRGEHGTVAGS